MIINISDQNIYYKVFHEEFDPNKIYKAIAYMSFGETAWSQLLFINEEGMTYSVVVYKTRCVEANRFYSQASEELAKLGPCKTKGRSSDVNEIDSSKGLS